MDHVQQLADVLTGARSGIAFTGAGISTESGIPDFRSPGGVWAKHRPVYYDEFIASHEARVRYWQMRVQLYREFGDAKPNDGHRAIARLEELGKLAGVVTQNIDGLHQMAGSRQVVELHGTARVIACVRCGKEWPPDEVTARVEAGEEVPVCDECGSALKSKTIMFGQPMPGDAMAEAAELTQQADVFLAIGSSLVVEPAASFPRYASDKGATLVILNKTETPLDAVADLVIREPIGETFRAVMKHIDSEWR